MTVAERLRHAVRDVPDFPKPGILFRDITPILNDPDLLRATVGELARIAREHGARRIAGIDARGFIFGAAVALELGVGFVPIRKKGKLPFHSVSQSYDLEYGSAEIEVHVDAFQPGEPVAIIDDLLATGGTAAAAAELVRRAGAVPVVAEFVIELSFLHGRAALGETAVTSLIAYE